MKKSAAEEIRSLMNKLDESVNRHYDMELEVENWVEPEDPNDENFPYYLNLGIDYHIVGQYRPSTWGYHGGEPEEHPELDEYNVYNADTGEPITNIPPNIEQQIEAAIWKHAESRQDDYDPPFDDDRY